MRWRTSGRGWGCSRAAAYRNRYNTRFNKPSLSRDLPSPHLNHGPRAGPRRSHNFNPVMPSLGRRANNTLDPPNPRPSGHRRSPLNLLLASALRAGRLLWVLAGTATRVVPQSCSYNVELPSQNRADNASEAVGNREDLGRLTSNGRLCPRRRSCWAVGTPYLLNRTTASPAESHSGWEGIATPGAGPRRAGEQLLGRCRFHPGRRSHLLWVGLRHG